MRVKRIISALPESCLTKPFKVRGVLFEIILLQV